MPKETPNVPHTDTLVLDDERTLRDLILLCRRALNYNPQAALRLISVGGAIGVYANVISPQTILDNAPTVLALRAFRVSEPHQIDAVVEAKALAESLEAALDRGVLETQLPARVVTAAWAGTQPPSSGWTPVGEMTAESLRRAARAGMDAVAQALPENPGAAVVATVRNRIWAEPLEAEPGSLTEATAVPSGAALAVEVFGFLPRESTQSVSILASGNWLRLNAPAGYVLVKTGRGL